MAEVYPVDMNNQEIVVNVLDVIDENAQIDIKSKHNIKVEGGKIISRTGDKYTIAVKDRTVLKVR